MGEIQVMRRQIPCLAALLLGAAQMLDHFAIVDKAAKLRAAIRQTMAAKDRVTRDLGGDGTTSSFADAIISRL